MASDKFFDIAMQRVGIAQRGVVVADGIFDIFRTWNLRCELAAECDRDLSIGPIMQHKRRNLKRRQDRGDFDLAVNVKDRSQCSRTARQSLVFRELSDRLGVARLARATFRIVSPVPQYFNACST